MLREATSKKLLASPRKTNRVRFSMRIKKDGSCTYRLFFSCYYYFCLYIFLYIKQSELLATGKINFPSNRVISPWFSPPLLGDVYIITYMIIFLIIFYITIIFILWDQLRLPHFSTEQSEWRNLLVQLKASSYIYIRYYLYRKIISLHPSCSRLYGAPRQSLCSFCRCGARWLFFIIISRGLT